MFPFFITGIHPFFALTMSFLEDGEYELDVSILLDNPSTNNNSFNDNIAIRYGFIPDSMDQSKPLNYINKIKHVY